jgi:ADP-heptose:LPS heptosyltransferase
VAKTFPLARRVMLTNFPINAKAPASAAILGESGLIHDYMPYKVATRNVSELASLWWKVIRFNPEFVIYLMPFRGVEAMRRDILFFRAAGIRRIIGLPDPTAYLPILDEQTGMFEKEAERLARTVAALGDAKPGEQASWDLCLTPSEIASAEQFVSALGSNSFITLAPGTKMQSKDWGNENWSLLLSRLWSALPHSGLALVGAQEDAADCDLISKSWGGAKINLCGRLTPRQTAAVIQRGSVFIGPDSGPMHLAAAVGVPCAIAFSARGNPGVWFPAGQKNRVVYHKTACFGCNLETCIEHKKKCLTSISVDEMFAAVMGALR